MAKSLKKSQCTTTTTAALGCQPLLFTRSPFRSYAATGFIRIASRHRLSLESDHTQAALTASVDNDKILEHHTYHRGGQIPRATDRTQPYSHHSSPTDLGSRQHLGIEIATFLCVRAQRTGRRLHKWNSWACVLLHAISGGGVCFWRGYTMDYGSPARS